MAIGHSGQKMVRVVGVEDYRALLAFAGMDGTILGLAFHPTGKTLAGGDALCCGVSADQVVEAVGGAR